MMGSREVVDDGILEEGARGDDVMYAGGSAAGEKGRNPAGW
jgi:hypothetical protein